MTEQILPAALIWEPVGDASRELTVASYQRAMAEIGNDPMNDTRSALETAARLLIEEIDGTPADVTYAEARRALCMLALIVGQRLEPPGPASLVDFCDVAIFG